MTSYEYNVGTLPLNQSSRKFFSLFHHLRNLQMQRKQQNSTSSKIFLLLIIIFCPLEDALFMPQYSLNFSNIYV